MVALAFFAHTRVAEAQTLVPPWERATPPANTPPASAEPQTNPPFPGANTASPAQPAPTNTPASAAPSTRRLPPVGLELGYQFNVQDWGDREFVGERTASSFRATGADLGLSPAATHSLSMAIRWQFAPPLGLIARGSYGALVSTRDPAPSLAAAMPSASYAWSARGGLELMLRAGPVLFSGSALAGANGVAVSLGGFAPVPTSSCTSRGGCVRGQRQPTAGAAAFSGEFTAGASWIVRLPDGGAVLPGVAGSLLLNPGVSGQLLLTVGLWLGRVAP